MPSPLLHLWDPGKGEIERSFFPQPGGPNVQRVAASFGVVGVAVRDSLVAAVTALVDTVYLFGIDGTERGVIPVPLPQFRPPPDLRSRHMTSAQIREYQDAMTLILDIFWPSDSTFVLQVGETRGSAVRWSIVEMDRKGRLVHLQSSIPRLLLVRDRLYYFVSWASDVPNQWTVFRRRDTIQ